MHSAEAHPEENKGRESEFFYSFSHAEKCLYFDISVIFIVNFTMFHLEVSQQFYSQNIPAL